MREKPPSWTVVRCWVAVVALSLATACGSEPTELVVGPAELSLQVDGPDGTQACDQDHFVEDVRVDRFNEETVTWEPTEVEGVPCQSEPLDLSFLGRGLHRLRVRAFSVVSNVRSLLYEAELDYRITAEGAEPTTVTLQPQLAFLALHWALPEDAPRACDSEDPLTWSYEIVPAPSLPNARTFAVQRLPCFTDAFEERSPLPPGEHVLTVSAVDASGELRYQASESRLLVPGVNEVRLILQAVGGRVKLDWEFSSEEQDITTRDCDEAEVDEILVRLVDEDRPSPPLLHRYVDCSAARPIVLPGLRFSEGRELRFDLSADGVHRFRGSTRFTMPATDVEVSVSLIPHGQATVGWEVAQACREPVPSGYEVSLWNEDQVEVWARAIPYVQSSTVTSSLPYGAYDVRVAVLRSGRTQCEAVGRRSISAAETIWTFEISGQP